MDDEHLRFLVVEDSADTARLIAVLLERRFEASVDVATTLAGARASLARASYDVVTLDYNLPDGSGLDMLDEITASDPHPPVVMITGHGDEELAYLSFRMGASGYAAKNRKLSVVLPDAVEWAIADSRMARANGPEREDARLEGLVQAAHAASRDLQLELDAMVSASAKLGRLGKDCDPEVGLKIEKATSSLEKGIARSQALIEKLDSLVDPSAHRPQ